MVTVQLVGTPELTDAGALILCLFLFFSFLFFSPLVDGDLFFSTAEKRFRGNAKAKLQAFQNSPTALSAF